jgi:hypothetical protein
MSLFSRNHGYMVALEVECDVLDDTITAIDVDELVKME